MFQLVFRNGGESWERLCRENAVGLRIQKRKLRSGEGKRGQGKEPSRQRLCEKCLEKGGCRMQSGEGYFPTAVEAGSANLRGKAGGVGKNLWIKMLRRLFLKPAAMKCQ